MNYDPGWLKAGFQVATFVLSILVIIGTAGSWYFGRRDEAAREAVREKQRAEAQNQLSRIEGAIKELVAKGKLSRQDANKLIQVIMSEQLSLKESVQVEVKKAPPDNKP